MHSIENKKLGIWNICILILCFVAPAFFVQSTAQAVDPPLMEWMWPDWPDDIYYETKIIGTSFDQTTDGGYVLAGHTYNSDT